MKRGAIHRVAGPFRRSQRDHRAFLHDLRLSHLRIYVTSRPELDIRASLTPLASHQVSLHEESGQKKDIVDYVNSVVYSDSNTMMKR